MGDVVLADERLFGLADGVNSWDDPRQYPEQLLTKAKELFTENYYKFHSSPKSLLDEAQKITDVKGSSTCVLMTLTPMDIAKIAVIGNSGVAFYRKQKTNSRKPYRLLL